MTETTARNERRARRRGGVETGSAPSRTGSYRRLVNPFTPLRVFSDDQVEAMHQMALRILEELGMRVLLPEARRVFAAAGATVDEESRMVRLDRALVEESLAKAPREIELVAREPQRSVVIGGRNLAVVPVAGPPHVTDTDRGKRPGTLADYQEFTKLAQHFDVIHLLGASVEPQDIPIQFRHLDVTRTQLTLGDKTPFVYARGPGPGPRLLRDDRARPWHLGRGIRGAGPLLHRDQHQLPAPARYPDVPGHPRFRRGGAAPGHHPLHSGGRHGARDDCRAR